MAMPAWKSHACLEFAYDYTDRSNVELTAGVHCRPALLQPAFNNGVNNASAELCRNIIAE